MSEQSTNGSDRLVEMFGARSPSSVDDLTLVREREQATVNEFLEQRHPLGSVPGWKACFSARYADCIVAVVVLGRPAARHADDGTELSITRFCRRDDRPDNTGSWLIARARKWAELEGYDTLSAHAGVAGNYGTVYEAAGFDCVEVTVADGDGWTNRDGRDSWDDYERRKWIYPLKDDRNQRYLHTETDRSGGESDE